MRFGVMCSGAFFQQWQANAIMELIRHGHQPVLLIADGRRHPNPPLLTRIKNKKLTTLLFSVLENRMFRPSAKSMVSLEKELKGVVQLTCMVEQKGFSEYFCQEDIAGIRKYDLDFILRFGFNIIRGEILTAARHGVWSFHHDDELKYRGGPAGFWEIYQNDPVSGAILQQLTPKLDGGIILKKGYLKTIRHSWKGNLQQLLSTTSLWPALVADEIAGLNSERNPERNQISQTNASIYKVPGNGKMLLFLSKLLWNRICFYFGEFVNAEQWNVGVVDKPLHEIALGTGQLNASQVTWLINVDRSTYCADPSGFQEGNSLIVYAEYFSYRTMKGRINDFNFYLSPDRSVAPHQCSWNPAGRRSPVKGLLATGHHSYPYIVEHEGEKYCLPESCSTGKITLYRYHSQPALFVEEKILLDQVNAVDPTMVFFNDRWWLFFTDRQFSNTHLFIYHSREITGEYSPHLNNPVKIDICSARPAGTPFIHKGVLYRPAQDCSRTYGGRVIINEVLNIAPDRFEEIRVNAIEPVSGSRYKKGIHTLSAVGDITLIDGKYHRPNWHYLVNQLRKRFVTKDNGHV
jgi:hypothetical protein